jgi:LacI family transcriptional regulator
VAEVAGVSVSTVSRVLNDKDDVAPETYRKVRGVIEELGYTSSLAARGLRSRRMNLIGLTVSDLESLFSIQVMIGVNRAAADREYDLIVYTGGEWGGVSAVDREQRFVGLFGSGISDGVIAVTPRSASFSVHSPVVIVDPNVNAHGYPAVISTNREGVLAAMDYLVGLGHRRIGFIAGRPDLQCAVDRLQGYKDGLARAGIPMDEELIQAGNFTRRGGLASAQRLLDRRDRPTAIMASNDRSAVGAMKAIREAGLNVPDDVSVVGFDNTPDAAYAHPALTTVEQSIDRMGHTAAEMLIRLIEGKPLESVLVHMPTRLVVRESCRAVAGGVHAEMRL